MEDNMTLANEIVEEDDVAIVEEGEFDSGLAFALAGLTLATGAVIALVVKNKDKIEAKRLERQIKKLEKKGYSISKLEAVEEVETTEDNTEEESEA